MGAQITVKQRFIYLFHLVSHHNQGDTDRYYRAYCISFKEIRVSLLLLQSCYDSKKLAWRRSLNIAHNNTYAMCTCERSSPRAARVLCCSEGALGDKQDVRASAREVEFNGAVEAIRVGSRVKALCPTLKFAVRRRCLSGGGGTE
ncbi:hypothetical protein BOTBODRAFT_273899 [Botryobasidium botryosum FD-172 SS1]|uniref:Uncharacterized protein n=1 Tax=Botryobasidium botryosum (strain FD-172 SS1) TaxID=930990 RepID=A0A067MWE6_BOTB1|nr:hypothetical protein BOTBODRAFT_273899 [Botryobasidium botryosum FD-172 SS1]